jgi:hypothetical protein
VSIAAAAAVPAWSRGAPGGAGAQRGHRGRDPARPRGVGGVPPAARRPAL